NKYTLSNLTDPFAHLTNTSINKHSPTFEEAKEGVGSGCRWEVGRLREWFLNRGLDWGRVWRRIQGIVILTLLPVSAEVPISGDGCCFELYGFDVLLDEGLGVWLLEVNLSPALSVDSDVDVQVKKPLLIDTLKLIDITEKDGIAAEEHYKTTLSKKFASQQSLRKSPPANQNPTRHHPQTAGDFTKVFPYNKETSFNGAVKVGSPTAKQVITDVRKRFFV
ncbi:putative tubulin polyglutamylase ttll2, partial [Rhizophlyctis rosea]